MPGLNKMHSKKAILLVEDEAIIAITEQKLLEKYGYDVITANSGENAVVAIEKYPDIDLILMDINLGQGMDGTEAAEQILKHRDIPVLFLSSHAEPEVVEKTEKITSYGYVLKNSGITVLDASIRMAFKLFEALNNEKKKDAALIDREEHYRMMANNVPDIIYSLDGAGNIATINTTAFERYGYTEQDAKGKPFLNFIHPDDREIVISSFLKAIEEQRKFTQGLQFRIVTENGVSYWFELNSRARFDSKGGYAGEDGVLRDITERKKIELELISAKEQSEKNEKSFKQQNEIFSILLKNLSQGVFMVEAPSGKPILANDAAQKILGRGILADANFENLSEVYGAFRVSTLEPYPLEEMPIIMGMNGKSAYIDDMMVKRPDGNSTYLEIYGTPIFDSDGTILASLVSFTDITERKLADEALVKSEELYRKTFNAVDDYINIVDRSYRIILYNDAYSRSLADLGITNIKPGIDIFELCPFLPDKVRLEFESVFDTGKPLYTEESFIIGESLRWSETRKIPIKDQDGKTYQIVTVIHDVTESKKFEFELIAAKEKAEESETRFKAISEQAMDGIALSDLKGNYIFVNHAFCRMVGYAEEELLRMSVFDLRVPDDKSETFKGTISRGEDSVSRKKLLCKDKSTITVDINGKVTLINGQEMVIGIMRDVTKQVELENEIIAAKEKAEASGLRLQSMLDNMIDAFFQADLNGNFTYANPAALRMYRYSSLDEMIGIPASTLYAVKEERDELIDELKKSGIKLDWNGKGLRKDGTTFWVSMNVQVLRDKNGNVIGTQGVTRDITERKLAEEALRESETRYKLLFDAIPESVLLIGTDRLVVAANQASARLYGYESPEQLEGFDTRLLIAESDRDRAAQFQADILKGAEKPVRQYIEVRRDGSEFIAEVMSTTLLGPGQEVAGYIGITRDITSFVESQKALRESETKFRLLFETSMDFLYITTIDGKIIDVNKAASKISGYSLDELKQMNIMSLYNDPDERNTLVKKILEQGFVENYEIKGRKNDGSIFEILVTSILRKDSEGNPVGFQGVLKDITERKLAEEKILKSLREKELLIRELYHRTKNTIQVVRGMIVLQALQFSGNTEIRELVKNTEDRIQAISLVHQMLYQSQDLSQISIKEYIQNLSSSIFESYNISSDKIVFIFNIDEQSFLLDTAIPLGLIINELITNSIKYAFPEKRKGVINISLLKDKSGNNILHYSDNGVGFPDNFDFRNSSTLGLKLIYSFGEDQMLGSITMENNIGIRVSFTFPDNLYKARV